MKRGERTAEQRDEIAPFHHSITSSARASRDGGTARPSALAVFRLIASSYLVGACTGRSPGFYFERFSPPKAAKWQQIVRRTPSKRVHDLPSP